MKKKENQFLNFFSSFLSHFHICFFISQSDIDVSIIDAMLFALIVGVTCYKYNRQFGYSAKINITESEILLSIIGHTVAVQADVDKQNYSQW